MSGASPRSGIRLDGWRNCGWAFAASLLTAAAVAVIGEGSSAIAQVKVAVVATKAGQTSVDRGFSVIYDDRLADTLTMFDQHVQQQAWEKAFRLLADVPEEKWSAMLPGKDGFIRPASYRVRDAILALPAAGREAYRLFFDAKARLLFESVRNAEQERDLDICRTIVDRYFITTVGDDAADRLGDSYFQRGQFIEAARCWKSIFEYHVDTNLPDVKLLVKRAMALHHAGLADDFNLLKQQVERDHTADKVKLGGREVVAAEYLRGLEPIASKISEAAAPSGFSGLAPKEDATSAWQVRLMEAKDVEAQNKAVRNYYGAATSVTIVPAVQAVGNRLYCNWMGVCFVIDVPTGKTVWQSHELGTARTRLTVSNGQPMQNLSTSACGIAVGGGVVAAVSVGNQQNGRPTARLIVYDPQTGKELWSSERGKGVAAAQSFIGWPLIDDDQILAVSHPIESSHELTLRAFQSKTGVELWSLVLGTPQLVGDPDWGQQVVPTPFLRRDGHRIYVLTNDGALLAIHAARREIEWVFKCEPPTSAGQQTRFVRNGSLGGGSVSATPLIVDRGTLFFKENGGTTLYALDPDTVALKWKYTDNEQSNLVGVDAGDVYLFSHEVLALRRDTPALRWSTRLTVSVPGRGARVGDAGVLVCTPRGLFQLSKETGDLVSIFRGDDRESAGGSMVAVGGKLICVSNMAITAYPDPSAATR